MKITAHLLRVRVATAILLAPTSLLAADDKPAMPNRPIVVDNACLAGSRFHDVNLSKANFGDINLSRTTFDSINFSDITITGAQMGGALFKHIGLPPGAPGRQRALAFEECDLNRTTIRNCDLSGVEISRCRLAGMKIDGVLVTDLLEAYKAAKKKR